MVFALGVKSKFPAGAKASATCLTIGSMPTMPFATDISSPNLAWNNRFHKLGESFFTDLSPQALSQPYWVARSQAASKLIKMSTATFAHEDTLQALAGNALLAGSQPVATVYSGHQFGQWAGQLGDGRAILMGETQGWELQLKGCGPTPYSRMGDGRAVLRSSIREYLASEAMAALGVPTTRALSVVGSDAPVRRETIETAAVVTRLAPSFIRFGHFEHFLARKQVTELRRLADFVITHHYPECAAPSNFSGNPYCALLGAVTARTAEMVAHWQAVGFCHGVMNTDNMSILGLTLDYGPFQFLDAYDPQHICNHTDSQGRYAFERQPEVAHWNLFCLGQALLPLIEDTDLALEALGQFMPIYLAKYHGLMCAKLGLTDLSQTESNGLNVPSEIHSTDTELVQDILSLLAKEGVDYNIFWRRFSHAVQDGDVSAVRDLFIDAPGINAWLSRYKERTVKRDGARVGVAMLACNPKYVLRNYMGEQAIRAAQSKDFSVLTALQTVLEHPFDEHPSNAVWAGLPPDWADAISISCSS